MNIAIILAEVSLVLLVFLLLNWLFGKFSKQLKKVSMLRNEERNIKTVRRSITWVLLLLCDDKILEGIVEAIELRTTRIRHPNGQLHIIRNGEVSSITNFSKQYIYAVVEVSVAYDSNLADVYRVIEEVGEQLKADYPDILEATQVDGVENIGESHLLLRTLTKVNPGKHLQIQRVLRKILMSSFIREGIATTARAGG